MNQAAVQARPKRSGCGCLGLGCLVASIIAVLVGGGLTWFMVSSTRQAVRSYSADSGVAVPTTEVDDATRSAAEKKAADLWEVLGSPGGSGSFSFSGPELQALCSSDLLGKRVSLSIKDDAVHATFSFALADFRNPALDLILSKDLTQRFFNGSAVARLGVQEGHLKITFDELSLNGKSLEGDFLSQAGWFVGGAVESALLSSSRASKGGDSSHQESSGRIANAAISEGVLRLDIGP